MKNLYLLPTDSSRLHLAYDNEWYISNEAFSQLDTCNYKSFSIYITSDEKIRKGDWYLNPKTNKVAKLINHYGYSSKKVILTTDLDLIIDGVQAIPNEFLEWFTKNSSCKAVEVIKEYKDGYGNWYKYQDDFTFTVSQLRFKIIIPKEEPKEFGCPFDEKIYKNERLEKFSERFDNDKSAIGNPETWGKRVVKEYVDDQDAYGYDVVVSTLEEDSNSWHLAKELFKEIYGEYPKTIEGNQQHELIVATLQKGMVCGAKWQQEKSYSEEEVLDLLFDFQIHRNDLENCVEAREWFEQFKKKQNEKV